MMCAAKNCSRLRAERVIDMAFLKPDKVYEINGVTVKDYLLTEHNPRKIDMPGKRTKALRGVTIHNTEDIVAASGTTKSEQYTRATVNGNMGDVRVHYYVDDVEAWHNLPDDWIGWHAADGLGDGNMTTIAIECIGKTAKAEENAARLAAGLLAKYGLTTDNLFTHVHWMNIKHGATGTREYLNTLKNRTKNCPAYILPHWDEFEKAVGNYIAALTPAPKTDEPTKIFRIQVGAYSVRENAEKFLAEVKAAGFTNAFIAEVEKPQAPVSAPSPAPEPVPEPIKVGDTVRVKSGAKTYNGGSLAAFVYQRDHKVSEVNGDRAIITYNGCVIAAVNVNDLNRV